MSIETIILTQPSLKGKLSQVMPILAEVARANNLKPIIHNPTIQGEKNRRD